MWAGCTLVFHGDDVKGGGKLRVKKSMRGADMKKIYILTEEQKKTLATIQGSLESVLDGNGSLLVSTEDKMYEIGQDGKMLQTV